MKIVKNLSELIAAIGCKPGDTIEFVGSQHYRDYDLEIDFIPQDAKELKAVIATASKENLQKMGVCVWSTHSSQVEDFKKSKSSFDKPYLKSKEIHYLFPGEWYEFIPENFPVVDIFGKKEKFVKGESSNDIRFGCLAFGFIRNF